MRKQAPMLGTAMAVVGGLSCLAAAGYLLYLLLHHPAAPPRTIYSELGQGSTVATVGRSSVIGIGALLCFVWCSVGVLYIVAGLSIRRFRRRTLGIWAAAIGLVPYIGGDPCMTYVLTLGVGIWALVVLLSFDAAWAFGEVERGTPVEKVLADEDAGGIKRPKKEEPKRLFGNYKDQ